jgi:hypothetical protein
MPSKTLVSRDYIITDLAELPSAKNNLRILIIPFAIWKNNDYIINPKLGLPGLAKH